MSSTSLYELPAHSLAYHNRTPNKTLRNTTSFKPEFVVMHETAGYGSLDWNLRADVLSSYNYLILRDGTLHWYVDERKYIAWHAGVNSKARGYIGGQINTFATGVELEGPNDGRPITEAQWKTMLDLIRYFYYAYDIPISEEYYLAHSTVAPGYKSDPRGYSVKWMLTRAKSYALSPIKFLSSPTISKALFTSVLHTNFSPASPNAETIFDIFESQGVNPAVGLAFFKHESDYGKKGVTAQYDLKNWGNVRTPHDPSSALPSVVIPVKGSYARYPSWVSSVVDWCLRIKEKYIGQWDLDTVEKAIPKYAGYEDGNDVEAYIKSVRASVETWKMMVTPHNYTQTSIEGPPTKIYSCSLKMKDFYQKSGGVVIFGYPTSHEYEDVDPGSGRVCSFMEFENVVIRNDTSVSAPFDIRPIFISEAYQRVLRRA